MPISPRLVKILTNTAGAAGAGFILYDMHKAGQMISQQNIKVGIGNRLPDSYISSRRQNDLSTVTKNLKDKIFQEDASWTFPDKVNGFTGYIGGAFNQLSTSIVPALLTTGALLQKRFSKYCALGLGAYGILYVLNNIFTPGRMNYFKD